MPWLVALCLCGQFSWYKIRPPLHWFHWKIRQNSATDLEADSKRPRGQFTAGMSEQGLYAAPLSSPAGTADLFAALMTNDGSLAFSATAAGSHQDTAMDNDRDELLALQQELDARAADREELDPPESLELDMPVELEDIAYLVPEDGTEIEQADDTGDDAQQMLTGGRADESHVEPADEHSISRPLSARSC